MAMPIALADNLRLVYRGRRSQLWLNRCGARNLAARMVLSSARGSSLLRRYSTTVTVEHLFFLANRKTNIDIPFRVFAKPRQAATSPPLLSVTPVMSPLRSNER